MSREAGQETCHERRPPNTDPMGRGEQSRTCFVPNAQPAALPSLQRWDWALEAEGLSFFKGLRITATRRNFSVNGLFVSTVENDGRLLEGIEESDRARVR